MRYFLILIWWDIDIDKDKDIDGNIDIKKYRYRCRYRYKYINIFKKTPERGRLGWNGISNFNFSKYAQYWFW